MSDEELQGLDTKTLVCMIYKEVKEIKVEYVRKEEFTPVKRCCYAILGSVFVGTVTGIVALLVK